jgi:hypothetical protein
MELVGVSYSRNGLVYGLSQGAWIGDGNRSLCLAGAYATVWSTYLAGWLVAMVSCNWGITGTTGLA